MGKDAEGQKGQSMGLIFSAQGKKWRKKQEVQKPGGNP